MADDWNSAVKAAMKILGDKGKIPKLNSAIPKADAADKKSYDDFKKTRDELKAKLLATQNTGEALNDAMMQYQDEIDEDDLGLDPKIRTTRRK